MTIEARTASPVETWAYTLPSGRGGVVIGDVAWAAFSVLLLVNKTGWRRVHLRFPKGRWCGLRAQTITLAGATDLHRLRDVDVETLMRRHGVLRRGCPRLSGPRRVVALESSLGLRMPGVWPAVP